LIFVRAPLSLFSFWRSSYHEAPDLCPETLREIRARGADRPGFAAALLATAAPLPGGDDARARRGFRLGVALGAMAGMTATLVVLKLMRLGRRG
jgi:hypothetical protein